MRGPVLKRVTKIADIPSSERLLCEVALRTHAGWAERDPRSTPLPPYATSLRACYAMPSTDNAYGASCLRACYAMPGTDLALSAYEPHTLCAVLTFRMLVPERTGTT
eukprot:3477873-Rhodomonas_salina.8